MLRLAFGLAAGNAPDRFVVGLAVLSLLAEVAAERPLVCLVDDAQWLDEPTAQVLGFVARRLLAESVFLLLAVREAGEERLLPGLPAMTLEGLTDEDARALLNAAVPGHLDERVRDQIVAETRGNPLGLLDLPKGMSQSELAGGFAIPSSASLSGQLHDSYVKRVRALPGPTQQLMLLAAVDPTGDATLRGVPLRASTSDVRRQRLPTRSSCSISARGSSSGIPWCGRLHMPPDLRRIAAPSISHLPRQRTHRTIRNIGCGTWLRRRLVRTKSSRRSSSEQRALRRPAPGSRPQQPSSSVRSF